MYNMKQFDPSEWSSPRRSNRQQARGQDLRCSGAVNQKGAETAFLGALHAFKVAGRKLPVNLVLVCEGEEEIGSPHFPEVVQREAEGHCCLEEMRRCIRARSPPGRWRASRYGWASLNSSWFPAESGGAADRRRCSFQSLSASGQPVVSVVQALNCWSRTEHAGGGLF